MILLYVYGTILSFGIRFPIIPCSCSVFEKNSPQRKNGKIPTTSRLFARRSSKLPVGMSFSLDAEIRVEKKDPPRNITTHNKNPKFFSPPNPKKSLVNLTNQPEHSSTLERPTDSFCRKKPACHSDTGLQIRELTHTSRAREQPRRRRTARVEFVPRTIWTIVSFL